MKNRHIKELDFFNAAACLLVILIHVLSLGITSLRPDSWQLAILYFPWQLSAFVVPGFLFVGGVKLARADDFRYGKYILRRVKKVYIPYIIWTVVYYAAFILSGFTSGGSVKSLLRHVVIGDLSGQFYYVIIVMQFYLLAPVWRLLVKKLPWYSALIPALFATMVLSRLPGYLGFGYGDRLFTSYLWFWVAGLYAGRHYDALRRTLAERKSLPILGAAVSGCFALLCYLRHSRGVYVWDLDSLKLMSDSGAILLVLSICCRIADGKRERLQGTLAFIHKSSYGAYLSHCLPLTLGTFWLQGAGMADFALLLPIRLALCLLPFACYSVLFRLKSRQ